MFSQTALANEPCARPFDPRACATTLSAPPLMGAADLDSFFFEERFDTEGIYQGVIPREQGDRGI